MTGFELERVEILLRERSAEMTRTRATAQLHPSLDGPVLDQAAQPDPTPIVDVALEGCVDCGERISAARLRAIPGVERCVNCQRELEAQAG